jgi:hypothetical protein
LKVTTYPLLQSCPTDSKECLAIQGETCAIDAAAFRCGMLNSAV